MMILNKIDRVLNESVSDCTMYWCIPTPSDDGHSWGIEQFEYEEDIMSSWLVVIYKLKHLWNKDLTVCKNNFNCLPRCVLCGDKLYHGNNLPVDINRVCEKVGGDVTPVYDKRYGLSKDDLENFENIIGVDLGLDFTE